MSSAGNAESTDRNREIRIRNDVTLPVDPLFIKTMAEYNFALLSFRNWFEYDEKRKPSPGIIEHWEFDSELGLYTFFISSNAKWSDGSLITSSDLRFNLDRAVFLNTTYGRSISAIVDITKFNELSTQSFELIAKDKKLSSSFFERMGSIFLSVINPKDVDSKTLKAKTNIFSAGPYVVAEESKVGIELIQNKYFPISQNSAVTIMLGKSGTQFDLDSFLDEKSWENLAQLTSFVSADWEEKIVQQKLPYWARGHDRVSIFRPGFGPKNDRGRRLIRTINAKLSVSHIGDRLPFNVARAYSLQPEPYPLHHEKVTCEAQPIPNPKVKILATDSPLVQFHIDALNGVFNDLNLEPEWDIQPYSNYIQALSKSEDHDIIFLSFGVADPESSTWVSLIKDAKFVDFDDKDLGEIIEVLTVENREESGARFTQVLKDSLRKGGYVPLFFGSTMALAHHGLSFREMSDLDETVNLSKIVFD